MSVLDESIRQILSIEGTRAAAVIDAGTGMIVCSAGELDPGIPDAAAAMAEEARAANSDGSSASGVLEGIATMSDRWCHLLEVLELRRGEGLLLFVDVDRSITNIALAGLQVRRLITGLLA